MALTTLDPKPALIVIDLQKGIVDAPTVHPTREIVERPASLANTFRRHALPVVLVNVTGGAPGRTDRTRPPGIISSPDWADLVDELDMQPDDHLVTKQRRNAFHDTGLDAHLRGLGVTQVVLHAHANSIERIFPKLGETTTTAEILDMLGRTK